MKNPFGIEERIRRTERKLRDAEWHYDKWSFGNKPSEDEDEEANIRRLKTKLEELRARAPWLEDE